VAGEQFISANPATRACKEVHSRLQWELDLQLAHVNAYFKHFCSEKNCIAMFFDLKEYGEDRLECLTKNILL
jgi:hypothetical protein